MLRCQPRDVILHPEHLHEAVRNVLRGGPDVALQRLHAPMSAQDSKIVCRIAAQEEVRDAAATCCVETHHIAFSLLHNPDFAAAVLPLLHHIRDAGPLRQLLVYTRILRPFTVVSTMI